MKTLYLLRHAKSSWDDPRLDDFDRPLAKRGRRACAAIADHIESEGIRPELVLCSPARRTRDTLAGILHAMPAESEIQRPDELYGASAGTILAIVNDLPDEVGSALMIAHNPGIQAAALQLAADGEALERVRRHFPTAALATLGFNAEKWRQLAPAGGYLSHFVLPRELE